MGYFGGDPGDPLEAPDRHRLVRPVWTRPSPARLGTGGARPQSVARRTHDPRHVDQEQLAIANHDDGAAVPETGRGRRPPRALRRPCNDPLWAGRCRHSGRVPRPGKLIRLPRPEGEPRADAAFDNWFHPETGESATARKGSKEAERLSRGGYIKGTHKQREGGVPLTEALAFSREFTGQSKNFKETQTSFKRLVDAADRKTRRATWRSSSAS